VPGLSRLPIGGGGHPLVPVLPVLPLLVGLMLLGCGALLRTRHFVSG
jgi:hypothetical protein